MSQRLMDARSSGLDLLAFIARKKANAIESHRLRVGPDTRGFHRGYKLAVDGRTRCFRVKEFRDAEAASLRARGIPVLTWDGAGVQLRDVLRGAA